MHEGQFRLELADALMRPHQRLVVTLPLVGREGRLSGRQSISPTHIEYRCDMTAACDSRRP